MLILGAVTMHTQAVARAPIIEVMRGAVVAAVALLGILLNL